jgi:hypothetical protein
MQNDLGFVEERERITVVLARDGVSHRGNNRLHDEEKRSTCRQGEYARKRRGINMGRCVGNYRLSLFHRMMGSRRGE